MEEFDALMVNSYDDDNYVSTGRSTDNENCSDDIRLKVDELEREKLQEGVNAIVAEGEIQGDLPTINPNIPFLTGENPVDYFN